jgi:hypothetical protein
MRRETALLLYNTAMRFLQIRDLPLEQCKRLMALPEDQFKIELSQIRQEEKFE